MDVLIFSENTYFHHGIKGVLNYLPLRVDGNNIIIDFDIKTLRGLIINFDEIIKNEMNHIFLICNSKNLLPLAAFIQKNYKNNIELLTVKRHSSNKTFCFESVRMNFLQKKISKSEYKVLLATFQNIDANQFAKKNNISKKTYYTQRKSLHLKLDLKRNSLY